MIIDFATIKNRKLKTRCVHQSLTISVTIIESFRAVYVNRIEDACERAPYFIPEKKRAITAYYTQINTKRIRLLFSVFTYQRSHS